MSAFLYIWNPDKWAWSDLQSAIYRINNGKQYDMYWSCGNTKRIAIGDMFFLMRLGVEPKGIIGCGYVLSKPYYLKHWNEDKATKGQKTLRTDLLFKSLSDNPILTLKFLKDSFPRYDWTPQSGGVFIPTEVVSDLLELIQNDKRFEFMPLPKKEILRYTEGKPKLVTYRTYDRSPTARQACIEYYGYVCNVCGFCFEEVFGKLGKDYIEVHHLKQVADIGKDYEIDPVKDLRPVCANCHRMLHKQKPMLSIKELKSKIKEKSAS